VPQNLKIGSAGIVACGSRDKQSVLETFGKMPNAAPWNRTLPNDTIASSLEASAPIEQLHWQNKPNFKRRAANG